MSWARYLLHDFWTAREFNRIDERERASRRARVARNQSLRKERDELKGQVEALERDVEESALLLRTLADLVVEKGLIAVEELQAKAAALDALDGRIDGRLGKAAGGDAD
ncbi:MAG: hypothetical protein KDC98_04210 [Planctomycetes bacterium]|nr:hypothetical protein [Planctomycetota bacterium]